MQGFFHKNSGYGVIVLLYPCYHWSALVYLLDFPTHFVTEFSLPMSQKSHCIFVLAKYMLVAFFSRYCCGPWENFINVLCCNKHSIFLFWFFPDAVVHTCKSVTLSLWRVFCILVVSGLAGKRVLYLYARTPANCISSSKRGDLLTLSLTLSLDDHGYGTVIPETQCI